MNETIRMQLSAYVDGELPESETELLLRRLSQDAELRSEVAEFLEIGRVMRGEHALSGIHSLRQKVWQALDSDNDIEADDTPSERSGGYLKPIGGFAVAAGVALLAIFALQGTPVDDAAVAPAEGVAVVPEAGEYTVPPADGQLREYLRMHGESSSANGANGMNVRIANFELLEEAVDDETATSSEDDAEVRPAGVDETPDDTPDATTGD